MPRRPVPTAPPLDREILRELARCYMRAAVDALIEEQNRQATSETAADNENEESREPKTP